ncbi:MAG: spondin domain-containing protein [Bacteroidota bacterium]
MRYFLLLGFALLWSSCNPEDLPKGERYEVTFTSLWTPANHPVDYPENAHFSRAVGMTHTAGSSFFLPGNLASEGVKVMAETGDVEPLDAEIQALVDQGDGLDLIVGERLPEGTTSASFTIAADEDHAFISLVSMLAPSPDWFVAVENISLRENGEWVESITVQAATYDAGTDSGASFASENLATSPAEPIYVPAASPTGDGVETYVFATFTFKRM